MSGRAPTSGAFEYTDRNTCEDRTSMRQNGRMVATSLRQAEIGGASVWVEAVVVPGSEPTSTTRVGEALRGAFSSTRDVLAEIASGIVDGARDLVEAGAAPDEICVELGFGVSTGGNLVLLSASTEASLKVTLTYKRPSTATSSATKQ